MTSQVATALALVANGFRDITDKSGEPYIFHLLRVMSDMPRDEELQAIALLHDAVEDKICTIKELHDLGFSERIIEGVRVLTHKKEEDYLTVYIRRIATNKDAVLVKLADLKDNSDITRLKGLTKKDHDRMEKYHNAYTYLKEI